MATSPKENAKARMSNLPQPASSGICQNFSQVARERPAHLEERWRTNGLSSNRVGKNRV
jgi:hypothetical protein